MQIVEFERSVLQTLLARFCAAVRRLRDLRLARDLERDLLSSASARLHPETFHRFAKWCKTSGIYAEGMIVAKEISLLLFGRVLDRNLLVFDRLLW